MSPRKIPENWKFTRPMQMWGVVAPTGCLIAASIRYRRRWSMRTMNEGVAGARWKGWYRLGYRCVKVSVRQVKKGGVK